MNLRKKLVTALFAFLISLPAIVLARTNGAVDSGGVPPHQAITTMKLVMPEAGIDYPTERPLPHGMEIILSLFNTRIPIFDDIARLEAAQAGIDYPTDIQTPFWTRFQKVLSFNDGTRVPVRLLSSKGEVYWKLQKVTVKTSDIIEIRASVAGVDYPTGGPAILDREFFVMILKDGSRLKLK